MEKECCTLGQKKAQWSKNLNKLLQSLSLLREKQKEGRSLEEEEKQQHEKSS